MNKIVIMLSIIILMMGCKNSAQNKKSIIIASKKPSKVVFSTSMPENLLIIDIDNLKEKTLKFSEIFKSIRYVPLETTKESIIGSISHIELINDTLYILDSSSSKSLFQFSISGEFIRKIGIVGKGPGEHIMPSSFSVDDTKKDIYILDSYLQKINVFSTNGIFKYQIKYNADVRSNYIEFKNGELYLDARMPKNSEFKYLIRQINNKGVELKRWLRVPDYNKGWDTPYYLGGSGTFYSAPNDIKYVELFMDTIFSISKGEIKPFIAIKTMKYLSPELLSNIMNENKNEIHSSVRLALAKRDVIWSIHNYVENDDLIYFRYNVKNLLKSIIISKTSNQPFIWQKSIDDLTFTGSSEEFGVPILYSGCGNRLIGKVINLSEFQSRIRKKASNIPNSAKNIILNLSEANNPIIIIYEME